LSLSFDVYVKRNLYGDQRRTTLARRILFKDKSSDYEVDEATKRIFNLRNLKKLAAFVVQ